MNVTEQNRRKEFSNTRKYLPVALFYLSGACFFYYYFHAGKYRQ